MMKSRTFLVSVIAHVAVGLGLLVLANRKQIQRAIAISSFGHEKAPDKQEKKPEADKPKPKPPQRPRPVAPRPQVARPAPAKAAPTPAQAPPPTTAKAALGTPALAHGGGFDTGLELSTDGPGIAVGPVGSGPAAAPAPAPRPVQPARRPASVQRKRKEVAEVKGEEKKEEVCTEMPTKPAPIARPEIEYTTAARAAGIEGRLVLRLLVAADGGVGKAEVLRGVDPGLDAAAVATVERWRFRPSEACGKPVAGGIYTLARRFELGD